MKRGDLEIKEIEEEKKEMQDVLDINKIKIYLWKQVNYIQLD